MLADLQPLTRLEADDRDAGNAKCGVDQDVAGAPVGAIVRPIVEFDDEEGVAGGDGDDRVIDRLGGDPVQGDGSHAWIASGDGEQVGEADLGHRWQPGGSWRSSVGSAARSHGLRMGFLR